VASSRPAAGGPFPRLDTRAVHAASASPPLGAAGESPHAAPLYQTANFTYPDSAAADRAAAGGAYLYSRDANPTTDALARALADLEGGAAGLSFASGMAAIASAVFAFATDGDKGGDKGGGEVIASEGLYGGSTELLAELGPRHGVHTRFVPAWDVDTVRAALGPRTRVILIETITNPLLRVADLPALGALAAERGVALIVDSTFATPCLCRPLSHGATVVAHSISKYVSGHGDLIGGVTVGSAEAMSRVRRYRLLLGGMMDPFCAWLALRGLRTMPLRVERQCKSAAYLADRLAAMPGVVRVHYPGRADHPDSARARELLATGGAMVSFELAGAAAARRLYDRLRVVARAASLGEVSSLPTHPASFSHRGVSAGERARLGITDGLLRLSVGIEAVEDLEDDLRQALG